MNTALRPTERRRSPELSDFPLHLCEIRKDQGESEMKKRFFALFLTMALLLPAVLLSGCASADSGIMDTANLNATAAAIRCCASCVPRASGLKTC